LLFNNSSHTELTTPILLFFLSWFKLFWSNYFNTDTGEVVKVNVEKIDSSEFLGATMEFSLIEVERNFCDTKKWREIYLSIFLRIGLELFLFQFPFVWLIFVWFHIFYLVANANISFWRQEVSDPDSCIIYLILLFILADFLSLSIHL
jgi:hypothetical protein